MSQPCILECPKCGPVEVDRDEMRPDSMEGSNFISADCPHCGSTATREISGEMDC